MDQQLKQAKTMAEILKIVSEHYDLNQPLGVATGAVVKSGVLKVIKIINAPKK